MGEPVGGVDPGGECLQGGPEAENGALVRHIELGHIDDDAGSGGTPCASPLAVCTPAASSRRMRNGPRLFVMLSTMPRPGGIEQWP